MKIDEVRKLHQRKYRELTGRFIVEGEHPVLELLKAAEKDARLRESTLYCTREYANFTDRLPVQVVNPTQMAQICETRTPQGIVAVAPLLAAPPPRPGERAIYLHGLQDPGNLGTILRTLAWFGDFRCLLGPGSVDVHNGKVVRASMGAIFHVPVEADVPPESLPARFRRIALLDMQGTSIAAAQFRRFDCYVFGSEARGLPNAPGFGELPRFSITGAAPIESLNVAMAVAICQYELHRPAKA
jgi:TrmH family RNA methyltransferase